MLVIRMQRTGRKGHAQFRVVVQDSRRTPTSGKVVARLGHFNPHTKQTVIDMEKAQFYLDHGAQPSERVTRLLKSEGIKLPAWVNLDSDKKRSIRNPEKLRKNRPAEEKPAEPAEEQSAEATEEAEPAAEAPAANEAEPTGTEPAASAEQPTEAESEPEAPKAKPE